MTNEILPVKLTTYEDKELEYIASISKPPFSTGRAGWCRSNNHIDRKRRKDLARELTRKRMAELKEMANG